MKQITFLIFFITVMSGSILSLSGQKAELTGTWNIDRSKSSSPGDNFPVLKRITIKFEGNTLRTERVYDTGDGQEYPFTENVTLDGKEHNIYIYDMPRKSKATLSEKEGTLLFESVTTFYGSAGSEDFKSSETWKTDKSSNSLTISFVNNVSGGESKGALVYTKAGQ